MLNQHQRIRAGHFATLFSEGLEPEPAPAMQAVKPAPSHWLREAPARLADALFGPTRQEAAPAFARTPQVRASSAT
jgi:hypothetical protein